MKFVRCFVMSIYNTGLGGSGGGSNVVSDYVEGYKVQIAGEMSTPSFSIGGTSYDGYIGMGVTSTTKEKYVYFKNVTPTFTRLSEGDDVIDIEGKGIIAITSCISEGLGTDFYNDNVNFTSSQVIYNASAGTKGFTSFKPSSSISNYTYSTAPARIYSSSWTGYDSIVESASMSFLSMTMYIDDYVYTDTIENIKLKFDSIAALYGGEGVPFAERFKIVLGVEDFGSLLYFYVMSSGSTSDRGVESTSVSELYSMTFTYELFR